MGQALFLRLSEWSSPELRLLSGDCSSCPRHSWRAQVQFIIPYCMGRSDLYILLGLSSTALSFTEPVRAGFGRKTCWNCVFFSQFSELDWLLIMRVITGAGDGVWLCGRELEQRHWDYGTSRSVDKLSHLLWLFCIITILWSVKRVKELEKIKTVPANNTLDCFAAFCVTHSQHGFLVDLMLNLIWQGWGCIKSRYPSAAYFKERYVFRG